MKCYTFKELTFKYGLFDSFIDCTYIYTQNNDYLYNIKKQLNKFKPSKKLFIYIHKCSSKKYLTNQQSSNNTIDIYYNIFNHSFKNNYHHILILKDDFIFKRLILQEDISNIKDFIEKNEQHKFILSIGTFPIIYYMINKNFNKSLFSLNLGYNIYSKEMRNYLLKNKDKIDYYHNYDLLINKYFYKKTLIYTIFKQTENEKVNKIKYLIFIYMKILNFEKKQINFLDNHYSISNILSKIIFIKLFLFTLLIIYFSYLFIQNLVTNQNSNQNIDS